MVSWFWLVGAVVLSLLPPFVTYVIGGTEDVVTAFLAIFSIAVAIGSGLAAWLAAGRIVLLPTVIGAVLLGVFAVDLGFATLGAVAAATPQGPAEVFSSALGLRVTIDLAGIAIAGGLYIVPAFAADPGLGRARPPRPRHRRRQRAQLRLHRRRHARCSPRCRRWGSARRCCS